MGFAVAFGRVLVSRVVSEDPASIGWATVGASYICESTGVFTAKEKAELHIKGVRCAHSKLEAVVISNEKKEEGALLLLRRARY